MTDKPILFSGPMIRALLAGRKTQTRRLLTKNNTLFDGGKWPNYLHENQFHWDRAWIDNGPSPAGNAGPYLKLPVINGAMVDGSEDETVHRIYPKMQVRDRLWVRECIDKVSEQGAVFYRADDDAENPHGSDGLGWRPSIHMPRWASRLTLIVTDVRVQRLKDISEADAVAEGVNPCMESADCPNGAHGVCCGCSDPIAAYATLWESLHGAESHKANPWVIATSFTVHHCNIDAANAPKGE